MYSANSIAPRWLGRMIAVGGFCLLTLACSPEDEDRTPAAPVAPSLATGSGSEDLIPLSRVPVPRPAGNIINRAAAVRLGKAFFWEAQVGGNGRIACATCHFVAGADGRHTAGSDGMVQAANFNSVNANANIAADNCTVTGGQQTTGRNTPTNVGAVFFRDLFHDGRANHRFNGLNPFGFTGNNTEGSLASTIDNAGAASQAVGPPNNPVEMSCNGRPFNGHNVPNGTLATKLLARIPLGTQRVRKNDGDLGSLSNWPAKGLNTTYQAMINAAFSPSVAGNAVNNFSAIWGQAIQAWEGKLIPDQTPLDQFLLGNTGALTEQQQRGLNRFTGKGGCTKCHLGGELSDATIAFVAASGLINEDGGDQGFHNIGVSPTNADLGRAATGPGGVAFSVSGSPFDRGAFKTPTLRNVKLTAPYFHFGQKQTLAQVVQFYADGGDFPNAGSKAKRIKPISFDADDKAALVDFLTNALTDCRVEKERAPFDHPSLPKPSGSGNLTGAVGRNGRGPCP